MYAKRIIEAKINKVENAIKRPLIYHTLAEVLQFKEDVNKITEIDQNSKNSYIRITKWLNDDQRKYVKQFIENEQLLCTCDESYFATRYAYICDEKGDIYKFAPRASQKVFDSVVAYFEELEVAIELLVLKARQVGISTRTALMFLHRMLFIPHTQAVMASAQGEKSELIGRILSICYERLPWWLPARLIGERVGKQLRFDNGSILSIQSGMQATGIAQGWTPTSIHISELADIPNPKKTIEEGLLRATHSSRKLFQVFEGTGGGSTGWLADFWRAAKEDFPLGKARFCPLFISWPLATDLYPEADWLKKFPVPSDFTPMQETRKHVKRCELYIRSTPFLAAIMGENWSMPVEQQHFWQFNYLAAKKTHTTKTWLSQMPADDSEALTGKFDYVFEKDVIEIHSRDREKKYTSYAIIGRQIDEGFEPAIEIIDYNEPRIVIEHTDYRENRYQWTLIPLLPFNEKDENLALDRLIVFEPPKQGRQYAVGIDTADGLDNVDEERSVMCVTLSARGYNPDVQVAEFCSRRVNPAQMVGFAGAVGAWYGQKSRDARGVKWCIEQRDRPGDDCQHQLKLMGFLWHHKMTRYDDAKVKENGNKEGWYSNVWSVPFLMNRFTESINNGWFKINSPFLLEECRNLERKVSAAGRTKMAHQSGKFDDRVRAAAQSYITMHHMEVLNARRDKVYARASSSVPELNRSHANVSQISVGV